MKIEITVHCLSCFEDESDEIKNIFPKEIRIFISSEQDEHHCPRCGHKIEIRLTVNNNEVS